MSFPPDKLPPCRKSGIPSTCGCALFNDVQMNLRLADMMYCEYQIGTDQQSLNVQSGFFFFL